MLQDLPQSKSFVTETKDGSRRFETSVHNLFKHYRDARSSKTTLRCSTSVLLDKSNTLRSFRPRLIALWGDSWPQMDVLCDNLRALLCWQRYHCSITLSHLSFLFADKDPLTKKRKRLADWLIAVTWINKLARARWSPVSGCCLFKQGIWRKRRRGECLRFSDKKKK